MHILWATQRLCGPSGPLLPQSPLAKVEGEASHLFQWVFGRLRNLKFDFYVSCFLAERAPFCALFITPSNNFGNTTPFLAGGLRARALKAPVIAQPRTWPRNKKHKREIKPEEPNNIEHKFKICQNISRRSRDQVLTDFKSTFYIIWPYGLLPDYCLFLGRVPSCPWPGLFNIGCGRVGPPRSTISGSMLGERRREGVDLAH